LVNQHVFAFSEWPTNGAIEFKGYAARYRPELDLVLRLLYNIVQYMNNLLLLVHVHSPPPTCSI